MSFPEFDFGVETEAFWKRKAGFNLPDDDKDHRRFAEALVPCYNKIRPDMLRTKFDAGAHPGHHEPDHRWIVALDGGIGNAGVSGNDKRPEGHPLEFVSPIMRFGQSSEWETNVEKHWETLSPILDVELDSMCATHVHVSLKGKGVYWNLEQLKRFAKAAIYFNKAFKAIWAPSRRDHPFTQSNKDDNYILKGLDFAACFTLIEKCASMHDLIKLMQAGETKAAQQSRDYAWNFENTVKEIGTIEFRCAPGVTNAKHCFIWVEFAVSFVQAGTQFDTSQVLEKKVYKDDAKGLEEFILRAGVNGMNKKDLLAIVFQKKNDSKKWESDDQMRAAFDESLSKM